jgi:hypothetical protein
VDIRQRKRRDHSRGDSKMTINSIDSYKDGGTVEIKTDSGTFYLDHKAWGEGTANCGTGKLFDGWPREGGKEVVRVSTRQEVVSALKEHSNWHESPDIKRQIDSVANQIESI